MIAFHESCCPPKANHHAKRIVRVGGFARLADKPELVAAKSFWDALFLLHRPEAPLEGPLLLDVQITWPWNAGDAKRVRTLGWIPHWTKPDCSNMAKTIEDSMARCGYFLNDAQIVQLLIVKGRGDVPGIDVTLEPWKR